MPDSLPELQDGDTFVHQLLQHPGVPLNTVDDALVIHQRRRRTRSGCPCIVTRVTALSESRLSDDGVLQHPCGVLDIIRLALLG